VFVLPVYKSRSLVAGGATAVKDTPAAAGKAKKGKAADPEEEEEGEGGGVATLNDGGNIDITDTSVDHNSSTGDGGAIANFGTLNVMSSTFDTNSSGGAGEIEELNAEFSTMASLR